MDRVDTVLVLGMLCLMLGTLLVGFSRPLWWMLHPRRPAAASGTCVCRALRCWPWRRW